MPKSNYGGKQWSHQILKRFNRVSKLARFLDVGPGIGTYTTFRQPDQLWTGVEVWAPYVKAFQLEKLYDSVVVCDVRYLNWNKVALIDVSIFGDVLEHMSKEDALETVDAALTHSRIALVSLPLIHSEQGEVHGNPFEAHVKPDWTNSEALEAFPDWCVYILESYIGVYFLSRRSDDIELLLEITSELKQQVQSNSNINQQELSIILRSEVAD